MSVKSPSLHAYVRRELSYILNNMEVTFDMSEVKQNHPVVSRILLTIYSVHRRAEPNLDKRQGS